MGDLFGADYNKRNQQQTATQPDSDRLEQHPFSPLGFFNLFCTLNADVGDTALPSIYSASTAHIVVISPAMSSISSFIPSMRGQQPDISLWMEYPSDCETSQYTSERNILKNREPYYGR